MMTIQLCCCTGMSWGTVLFTTFGGLRGAVSLILAQILVLDQEKKVLSSRHITAEVCHHAKPDAPCLCLTCSLPAATLSEWAAGTPACHSSADIYSQIALWTSGFVVLTLIINAPLMPWLLKVTGYAAQSFSYPVCGFGPPMVAGG